MRGSMAELDVLEVCVAQIKKDLEEVKRDLKEIKLRLELSYLTIKQYEVEIKPMRSVVYGMVTLVMTSVGVALIYLVVRKGGF